MLNELGGWGLKQLDSTGTGALCSDHSVAETGSVEASLFDGLLMEKRSRCRIRWLRRSGLQLFPRRRSRQWTAVEDVYLTYREGVSVC